MSEITYLKGDATYPQGLGNKVIVHICNNKGLWGKGFVLALDKRWDQPKDCYMIQAKHTLHLDTIQIVRVKEDIAVCNLIGQEGIASSEREDNPIRYEAIRGGLERVASLCANEKDPISVHMPRIGCGLAGGTWDKIEPIINETLISKGIEVFVYDYE